MRKFSVGAFLLFLIIVLTMAFNIEHTSQVYFKIAYNDHYSEEFNRWYSVAVMVVIDLAVIAFILLGKHSESANFAFILFWLNLIFFDLLTDAYNIYLGIINHQDLAVYKSEINSALAKVFFSGIFAYTIHRFSMLFYGYVGRSAVENKQLTAELRQLKAELQQSAAQTEQLKAEFQQNLSKLEQLQLNLDQFKCPYCQTWYPDFSHDPGSILKSLNAHKGSCSRKAESEQTRAGITTKGRGLSALINNHQH